MAKGAYRYIARAWQDTKKSGVDDLMWSRLIDWRRAGSFVRVDRPTRLDHPGEGRVLRRVEAVEAGAQDGNRAPAAIEGASVRRGVDATREPRHDRDPDLPEIPGEGAGEAQAEARGSPRADHRYRLLALPREKGATDPEHGWRSVDATQPGRIVALVPPHETDPECPGATCFGLGFPVRRA